LKCYVGIDLGSTTTKALILDEQGKPLGRGITNSRSNYDVACEVARNEAFLDARFNLLAAALTDGAGSFPGAEDLPRTLRSDFAWEQYIHLQGELEATCRVEADRGASAAAVTNALSEVFEQMTAEGGKLFGPDARPRSDFFRDIAGAAYMRLAQAAARRHDLPFERLLGIFDKSILVVENHVPEQMLGERIERALERSAQRLGLPEGVRKTLRALVEEVVGRSLVEDTSVGTGYGRARLPFPRERIRSEILCHGLGAHVLFPGTRTVLDIGGQDTKAIQIDDAGVVTGFQMNDRCAAGCGRYLGYIADEMNVGLHELGPLAQKATKPVRINSTCTVFAGAELRDRLSLGQRREDILGGLHRAIMLRAMSLLSRSGGIHDEFTFTGGVAKNAAAVGALEDLVAENYGERKLNISPDSIYTGALGAALFALRSTTQEAPVGATGGKR
jgi:benzoyl-CoA reductase subunit A